MNPIRTLVSFLLIASCASTQAQSEQGPFSLLDLPRMKNYSAHRVSSGSRYIPSNDDSKRIMPGETFVMADLRGPGVVDHIWLTVADNEFAWPRLVRLRVYYDGKKTPSVDVPLGDFFGVGHGYERNVDSMVVRDSSFGRARNSYWPMPFRGSCKITVTDEGDRPITMFYYHVDWQKHSSLPADVAYFHGYYRQERPAVKGKNYEFLSVKGAGHYVGTVLNVIQSQVGWFGEGDDLFYADGAQHPQILGTGTEDYVNEAWGLRVSGGTWYGTPVADGELVGARLTGYRWHIPDPIPFTKSLWAGIEHAGWTYNADGTNRSGFEERPDYFSSAAFWYQKDVNEGLPEPPFGAARLPLGNAEQIAVEESLAEVTTVKGKAAVQREVDWGRDLLFFEGTEKGSRINIPIDVRESGRYEILARIAQAPDYGEYVALLDDKPINLDNREALTSEIPMTGPQVLHNYSNEVYVAADQPLGWMSLTKGRHTLSFLCLGKDGRSTGYYLGINDVVLERVPTADEKPSEALVSGATTSAGIVYRGVPLQGYLTELRRASDAARRAYLVRAIGSFGKDATPAMADLSKALGDSDIEVRAAAAWALAQMGEGAAPALKGLEHALADPNARVRSTAAVALRAMGTKAGGASEGLMKALDDPMPYVRAAAADALGNIGAAAPRPVIDTLTRHLQTPNETIYVLRSVSSALGNIGPNAASALPELDKMMKMPRVIYAADEAIHKIKGEPLQRWY
ncbi:MAG TPA: DUF2961 domain-containing protein [Bryobacteraceae bacterium]|jgi:hypothetical protein